MKLKKFGSGRGVPLATPMLYMRPPPPRSATGIISRRTSLFALGIVFWVFLNFGWVVLRKKLYKFGLNLDQVKSGVIPSWVGGCCQEKCLDLNLRGWMVRCVGRWSREKNLRANLYQFKADVISFLGLEVSVSSHNQATYIHVQAFSLLVRWNEIIWKW